MHCSPHFFNLSQLTLFDKNQSEVERSFSGLKDKASSSRPRLHKDTVLDEQIILTFKRKGGDIDIFNLLEDMSDDKELNPEERAKKQEFRNG